MDRQKKTTLYFSLFWAFLFLSAGKAELEKTVPHDVDRLPNGNTLITDGGHGYPPVGSRIVEISPEGTLVAAWLLDLFFAHNADPTGTGQVIISDTGNNRVVEVDQSGAIIWNSDDHSPLSDGTTLDYPNDANLLATDTILITDKLNHRIIEIDRAGNIVWQFGVTGVPGNDLQHMLGPHNADRLQNGNTLLADSGNDRIMEVDPSGVVVMLYHPTGADALSWPRDADRLDNGNTLISDSENNRVIEIDALGVVVWELAGVATNPYDADRLDNGNTLVGDLGGKRVIEVDPSGAVVWEYPGTLPTVCDEVWIQNPTSGVDLFTHIHKPADAGPDNRYPACIWVPGGSNDGMVYHFDAELLASEGFVAVHFDPDGRGQSTNSGTYTDEDYCGFLHQDGLREVVDYVASLPEVDGNNIGIYSGSYGITMASGMLARYQDDPPVRYLIDMEGPADRNDTAAVYGGHVPVSPSNNLFWAEREAATFMPHALPRYVRIQTEIDHNPNITDNHHAVLLINAATNSAYGGSGIAPWTRVNREYENEPNETYTIPAPPVWISEILEEHICVMETLLIHECAEVEALTVTGNLVPGGQADFDVDLGSAFGNRIYWFALSWGNGPTTIPGMTTIFLDRDIVAIMTLQQGLLDNQGAAILNLSLPMGPMVVNTYYAQVIHEHPGSTTGYSAAKAVTFEVTEP